VSNVNTNQQIGLESGSCVLTASCVTNYAFRLPTVVSSKNELSD
jgi:hypothetical protein